MIQRNTPSIESPSIISIKNILSRIKEQISMRTITVAIRQYCMQQHLIHKKDQLLSFFLQCESKLKKYTHNQWSRVVNNQIRKIVGLEKLHQNIYRIASKQFLLQLKNIPNNDQDTQMQSILSQALGDLKDLQISEDIKIKTKYFFKWSTFIAQRREIKRLKTKQVDDIKKSKLFNQYSIKFQSFIQWKQYVRKAKLQNQKAKNIQMNCRSRLLRRIFLQINENTQVIIIQNLLQDAVQERMKQVKLKRVFSTLRKNVKTENANRFEPKLKENIWVYRFLSFLTSNIEPCRNKSSVQSRLAMQIQYQILSLRNCWKQLKMQTKSTNNKINNMQAIIKCINFKKMVEIKRYTKAIKTKAANIKQERKMLQYKHFFYQMKQGNQFEFCFVQKMAIVKAYLKNSNLVIFISSLKQSKEIKKLEKTRLSLLKNQIKTSKKQHFLKNIYQVTAKAKQFQFKNESLICFYLINTFKRRFSKFKHYKQSKCMIQKQLSSHHSKHLTQKAWSCLLRYKCIKASESQTLQSFVDIIQTNIKRQTFYLLKHRSDNLNRIQMLITKSQFVLLKISFITILNRMLSNKIKIKNFYQKQDLGLKRKLFQLLKTNSHIINQNSVKVKKLSIKFAKRRLIIEINRLMQQKAQIQQVQELQKKHEKSIFIQKLKESKSQIQNEKDRQNYIILMRKIAAVLRLNSSCNYKLNYRAQQQHKTSKINRLVVRNYVKSMRRLNRDRIQQAVINAQKNHIHEQKTKQIHQKIGSACILKLLRQKQSTINLKYSILINKQYTRLLQFVKLNYQSAYLKKRLKFKRFNQVIRLIQMRFDIKHKIKILSNKRVQNEAKKAIGVFQNNYYQVVSQRQSKMIALSELTISRRQKEAKKNLINRLQQHQELKQNTIVLINSILKQNIGHLIKSYLITKSDSIKHMIALRHYALNIKKRSFRYLKQALNATVLKQNRAKTEHHSKMSMQKSMDHVRRKSKLLQTIQRYNMSRISRVVR